MKNEPREAAINKNDVSLMADLFEAANQEDVEPEDDEELMITDVVKSSKGSSAAKPPRDDEEELSEIPQAAAIQIKNISDNLKLEFRPHQKAKPQPINQFGIIDGNYNEYCDSEVILVVDNREKRNANDINYFHDRFQASGIKMELRSLPLGDFLWILRVRNHSTFDGHDAYIDDDEVAETQNPDLDAADENAVGSKKPKKKKAPKKLKKPKKMAEHTDYVLDFIIERKTADDLAASIMDGRYEEQKFRLKNCGINNVIYLVEGTPG